MFFSIITRQAVRRGSFDSVKDLTTAIRTFVDGYNDRCQPSPRWTETPDEILPAGASRGPRAPSRARRAQAD